MTTTVLEMITILKQYPHNTVVTITDVEDVEFAIVNFVSENNTLNIVIGEKVELSEGGE